MTEGRPAARVFPNPWDDLFNLLSFWIFVWGSVAGAVSLAENAMLGIISLAIGFLTFFGAVRFASIAVVKRFLTRHRNIVVATAMFCAGFFYHAYSEKNSDESMMRAAAFRACAEFQPCVNSANRYGHAIGGFVEIFPAPLPSLTGTEGSTSNEAP